MIDKDNILENAGQYDAADLVRHIKNGIVTFEELCAEGEGFDPKLRKNVEKLLDSSEEDDWDDAKKSQSVEVLKNYIIRFPKSSHCEEAREIILEIEKEHIAKTENDIWENIDKNNKDALREFVRNNPNSPHCKEARKLITSISRDDFIDVDINALISKINRIQTDKSVQDPDTEIFNTISKQLDNNKIKLADVLEAIRKDNNLVRASVLDMLIANGYVEYQDFLSIGIDRRFVQQLANNERSQRFVTPKKIDRINKLSTEIYFWGIPASGKSCALGAILSVANNGRVALSMSKDNDCQGYGYMTRLSQLFSADGNVGTLPEGTSIYSTYEMGFDLEDDNHAIHPITCIDLAGELVRCMYKSDAGEDLSDDEEEALDTLTNILIDNRTKNRKIHFFVVEYGGEARKYEGLSQNYYLDSALRYIERTQIFKEDTDAIFLMISKVDKAGVNGSELQQRLREYISGSQYEGFYHGLERICRECEINGGIVEIVPFSLGQVCFQDYCLFKEAPAANVVRKLLARTKGFKTGKVQKGFNLLKK